MNGVRPTDGAWREYLNAARRKVKMAAYHLVGVTEHVGRQPESARESPIPLQAHFEGVLYSFIAATDQTAEALNLGLMQHLSQPNLQRALGAMTESPLRQQLLGWQGEPIADDVRRIRRRAAHHFYRKTPQGVAAWVVEPPAAGTSYMGSRNLDEYSKAAVEHLDSLVPLLDRLEELLRGDATE